MLDFRPLQLEDLPRLRPYFAYSGSRLCDTTPGTVFIWRDMYRTEYALWDNSLYFKVDYPGVGPTFTLPLGRGQAGAVPADRRILPAEQAAPAFCPRPQGRA